VVFALRLTNPAKPEEVKRIRLERERRDFVAKEYCISVFEKDKKAENIFSIKVAF
jgi:hypothetical protein